MFERNRARMERQAGVAARSLPVFLIADHGMADARQVDANLVFSTGHQIEFQQREVFSLPAYPIASGRKLSLLPIRRCIDDVRSVLRQVSRDGPRCLRTFTVHHREIFFYCVFPVILQPNFRFEVLGEDDYSRSFSVQAVHNEDPLAGLTVTLANISRQKIISRSGFLRVGPHRQQPRGFVHDENVPVFVQNLESAGQEFAIRSGAFRHGYLPRKRSNDFAPTLQRLQTSPGGGST